MKHLSRYLVGMMLMATASMTVQAQDAFYVYQNDGHFDGFFYDEVEKIRYSKIDTLGFEHEVYVSQEIVTADSIYRYMLSAIDSVGFVQPEIKFNPHLRNVVEEGLAGYIIGRDESTITIGYLSDLPQEMYPKVGDVLANFDPEDGWSGKVESVSIDGGLMVVKYKDIDDITDIFQQFITVEKFSHDSQGNLLSRRVAGRPELTVKPSATRASTGDYDLDILKFNINSHIPLGDKGIWEATIDPEIEGNVNVRVVWRLSTFGTKYIGITTTLGLGLALGFSIDGKIYEVGYGGLGQIGSIPIPVTTPILFLDLCPDGFLRCEGHIKFSAKSPKVKTSIWQKWEIKDWWPYYSMGFGNSGEDNEEETVPSRSIDAKMEFSGFTQAGLAFPLGVKSLPVIDKLFKANLKGEWLVGPKFSGTFSIDLSNVVSGDNTTYGNIKDTKVTVGLLDADYKITATVSSLFSKPKEWTLLDGTVSVLPSIDLYLFPEFNECEHTLDVNNVHKFAFEPKRNVLWPTTVGVGIYYVNDDGTETPYMERLSDKNYHQITKIVSNNSKLQWPSLEISDEDRSFLPGNYKVRPLIKLPMLGLTLQCTPEYDFKKDGAELKLSCDTIYLNYKGETINPITLETNCDEVFFVGDYDEDKPLPVEIEDATISTGSISYTSPYKNYHFCDSVINQLGVVAGKATIKGITYYSDPQMVYYCMLPNQEELPTAFRLKLSKSKTITENSWYVRVAEAFAKNVTGSIDGNIIELSSSGSAITNEVKWEEGTHRYTTTWDFSVTLEMGNDKKMYLKKGNGSISMVQNLINPTPLSEYSGGYFITYDEVTNSIANLPSDSFVGYMNPGPNYQAFDVYLNLPSGGTGKAYRNNRWPNDDHTSWVDEVDEEFNGTWGDGEGPFEFDIEFLFKDEADHLDDQGKYIHTD